MNPKRISRVLNPWWPGGPGDTPSADDYHEFDVDEYWIAVTAMGPEELIRALAKCEFWQVTLKWMGLTKRQEKVFWTSFISEAASKGRMEAIDGLPASRRLAEKALIKAARAYWAFVFPDLTNEDDEPLPTLYGDQDGPEWDCDRIGWEFVKLIAFPDGGAEALTKLAAAAKRMPMEADSKDTFLARAWRGFCEFVQKHETLPTIGDFQGLTGLEWDAKGQSTGSKVRKKLGLNLPISKKK
jgi:hypothetical protein